MGPIYLEPILLFGSHLGPIWGWPLALFAAFFESRLRQKHGLHTITELIHTLEKMKLHCSGLELFSKCLWEKCWRSFVHHMLKISQNQTNDTGVDPKQQYILKLRNLHG